MVISRISIDPADIIHFPINSSHRFCLHIVGLIMLDLHAPNLPIKVKRSAGGGKGVVKVPLNYMLLGKTLHQAC